MTIAMARAHQNKPKDHYHKLFRNSRFGELEKVYYEREQSSQKTQMSNVLLQILQMQEIKYTKEYKINGNTFKVYVVEDTEL